MRISVPSTGISVGEPTISWRTEDLKRSHGQLELYSPFVGVSSLTFKDLMRVSKEAISRTSISASERSRLATQLGTFRNRFSNTPSASRGGVLISAPTQFGSTKGGTLT